MRLGGMFLKFERLCDIMTKTGKGGYVLKLIHCSDLHLDSALGSNFSPDAAQKRNAELRATFARMVRFAVQEQVRAVLIAGDLFDSAAVSAHTAAFVAEQIRSAKDVTFFYLRGNHDESRNVFSELNLPDNLKTFGDTWTSCRCGDVVITAREPEDSGWLRMYDELRLDANDLNIVMLHGQISTQPGMEQIALSLLRNKHIRYLALGHLHAYKKAPLDIDGEYCYCGCPEGRGFDECGEKGFVLLETDGESLRHSFIPFAARTLHDVSVDISDAETVTQILSRMKQTAVNIPGKDMVKFTLTGTYTLQTQKDIHFLQNMLESDFWFVKIKDESRLKIDGQSYEFDASLKGEFVRSVMASSYSEAEKARIITCGIRALNGEEVVL